MEGHVDLGDEEERTDYLDGIVAVHEEEIAVHVKETVVHVEGIDVVVVLQR